MADEQQAMVRAMAALEAKAAMWCAEHGISKAVSDVLQAARSSMPDAVPRAHRIVMGLIQSAHMEGLYEGRTSLVELPRDSEKPPASASPAGAASPDPEKG